jgi:hypothetical protein
MAERKTETRCAPVEAIAVGPGRGVSQPQVGPKPASGTCAVMDQNETSGESAGPPLGRVIHGISPRRWNPRSKVD